MSVLQFTPTIRVLREMCCYNLELQLERELDRARASDLLQGVEASGRAAGAEAVPQRLRRMSKKGTA
jgi:hypothetical protein